MKAAGIAALLLGLGAGCGAQALAAAVTQALHPKLAQVATVENVGFDWEGLHFVLRRGQLALAAPRAGRILAAVFTGSGELEVAPPNAMERQQMLWLAGKPALAEPFTQAVFRFADGERMLTLLGDQVHFHALADSGSFDAIVNQRAQQIEAHGRLEGVRMLEAGQADPTLPMAGRLLIAELKTETHDWVEAVDDPMAAEAIRVHAWSEHPVARLERNAYARDADLGPFVIPYGYEPAPQDMPLLTGFDDTWTQFAPVDALTPNPPWQLDRYRLTLQVPRNWDYHLQGRDLRFTAAADLHVAWTPGRLLRLRLDSHLRVTSATVGGAAVEWLQPKAPAAAAAQSEFDPTAEGNWLLLELPAGLRAGDTSPLQLAYQPGDAHDLDFLEQNRQWYPAAAYAGPGTRASFEFTATSDPSVRVIAAGEIVRQERSNGLETTEWRTALPAAGYGLALHPKSMDGDQPAQTAVTLDGGRAVTLREQEKKQPILEEAAQALRYFSRALGPYPFPGLTLTQAAETWRYQDPVLSTSRLGRGGRGGNTSMGTPEYVSRVDPVTNLTARLEDNAGGAFSQPGGRNAPSFEGLGMVSPLSGWDQTQLHLLNPGVLPAMKLSPLTTDRLVHFMPAQAVAQQWLCPGGWAAPGDQWLCDGLARGEALLFVQAAYGNHEALADVQQWRIDLLANDVYGHAPNDDGALRLGPRLSTAKDPIGREAVMGEKGAYVLYMLHQLMAPRESGGNEDEFNAMMAEYVRAAAGQAPSTAEFEALAARYMTPNMDLDDNHRLDWFFADYVEGTRVPHLEFRAEMSPAPGGGTTVRTVVENPEGWRGLLPVYLMKSATGYERGWVRVSGPRVETTSVVQYTPIEVVANKFEDMLVQLSVAPPGAIKP